MNEPRFSFAAISIKNLSCESIILSRIWVMTCNTLLTWVFEFVRHERDPWGNCVACGWSWVCKCLSDVADRVCSWRQTGIACSLQACSRHTGGSHVVVDNAAVASSALTHISETTGTANYWNRGWQRRHLAELLGELFGLESEFTQITYIKSCMIQHRSAPAHVICNQNIDIFSSLNIF